MMLRFVVLFVIGLASVTSFRGIPLRSRTVTLKMGLDIPLIPAVALSSLAIFAVFNIDNKIDLTDEGVYKAKKARREAMRAEGKAVVIKKDDDADPFRWFAEEDEDIDIFPRKKSGGGCG
jgi:hypothetical protein